MHIILVGSLTTGFFSIGPFYSYNEADTYATKYIGPGYFLIMAVEKPATQGVFGA